MAGLRLLAVLGGIGVLSLACGGGDEPATGDAPAAGTRGSGANEAPSSSSSSDGAAPGGTASAATSGSLECDTKIETPAPTGCVTAEISCGETVEGNSRSGGSSRFDDSFYLAQYCSPERHQYGDAAESTYWLELPPNTQADVTLTSDCTDLDLASAQWNQPNTCPDPSHSARPCEMDTSKGGGTIRITTVQRPETHLLIVDGKKGKEGNYRISVKCGPYR